MLAAVSNNEAAEAGLLALGQSCKLGTVPHGLSSLPVQFPLCLYLRKTASHADPGAADHTLAQAPAIASKPQFA